MEHPLRIYTERSGVELRQLASETDDIAYFEAVAANREHLSQFGDATANKYPDLESVKDARENPSNPDKIRMGIWDRDTFVGSINLTPDDDGQAEIGYWLDARFVGRGYATIATKALARFAAKTYSSIYAVVNEGNTASEAVLERSGFQYNGREIDQKVYVIYAAAKVLSENDEQLPTANYQNLELFADLPEKKTPLRAKDKDNHTVFLRLGIAKKLYRCPCCHGNIDIGSSHVIMSTIQFSKKYNHHHIHSACLQTDILPKLSNIKPIKPKDVSLAAINARNRRYRNRKRRSNR